MIDAALDYIDTRSNLVSIDYWKIDPDTENLKEICDGLNARPNDPAAVLEEIGSGAATVSLILYYLRRLPSKYTKNLPQLTSSITDIVVQNPY